jgi:predicted anti-sigma-YlaC factor YlaD
MKCKKAQKLILTDYIDKQLSQGLQNEIESHINSCSECRQYKDQLLRATAAAFKNTEEIKPPDMVWSKIKQSISDKDIQPQHSRLVVFKNSLLDMFTVRKPALVFATMALMILIIGIVINPGIRTQLKNENGISMIVEKETEFLESLDISSAYNNEEINFGTSIEEYLL